MGSAVREEHKRFVQEASSLSSGRSHILTPASEASLGPVALGRVQPTDPIPSWEGRRGGQGETNSVMVKGLFWNQTDLSSTCSWCDLGQVPPPFRGQTSYLGRSHIELWEIGAVSETIHIPREKTLSPSN